MVSPRDPEIGRWEKKEVAVFNPWLPLLWGPSTEGNSSCQDPLSPVPPFSGLWQLLPALAPLSLEVLVGLLSPSVGTALSLVRSAHINK